MCRQEDVEKPKISVELLGESDENQVRNVEIQTRCGKREGKCGKTKGSRGITCGK